MLTDHRDERAIEFKFISLIIDSAVGLSAGNESAVDLMSETLGSNPAFYRVRQIVSFQFENRLPVPDDRN